MSVIAGAFLLWHLASRLSQIEPAEVAHAFASLPMQAWALAFVATAVSFWAVGHYDAVIHRHFATHLPKGRARLAGICAISVSQMIGLGVVSGAVLRWRMLPEIGAVSALRLTAAVALSFLGAWAMVTAAVLTVLPDAPFKGLASLVLALGLSLAALSMFAPRLGQLSFRWPNGLTIGKLIALCIIDTGGAAITFWLLCPLGEDAGLALVLPAFLLAFGAGLVSGSPGGMGAFEITLLALLPDQPEAGLLAAVLAWRLVYFAMPAILGAGIAIRGPYGAPSIEAEPDVQPVAPSGIAEAGLLAQGELRLIGANGTGFWLAGRTGHCLIGLFAPAAGNNSADQSLADFETRAAQEERLPVIYKSGPRLAAAARARGYQVRPIAKEAVIDLKAFDLATPATASLRRKLRKADGAGICSGTGSTRPDWRALDKIAQDWTAAHGTERGFSMGRYSRAYVQGQRLFIARLNDQPIAFVTFHATPREWTLDLMRYGADLPDGTMHQLIHEAITTARAEGVPRLSLAAVPMPLPARAPIWALPILARFGVAGDGGLARFKTAFAPRWESRYLCLRSALHLPLAALEIIRAVHWPPPLQAPSPPTPAADRDNSEIAFASGP